MNEILELISALQITLDSNNDKAFEEVSKKIKQLHKDNVIRAFVRGEVNSITSQRISAEHYYKFTYDQYVQID